MKMPECSSETFEKKSLKDTRIVFDKCGSNGFLPLRDTKSKSSCYIFSANTLKVNAIIVAVVILVFSTLKNTSLQILTPKSYDEHLRHVYMAVPPTPTPGMLQGIIR